GMFFDGFDVYVAATVLGATLKTGFSTLAQNAQFVSLTFVGMMLGSFITGFLGDRYGRRFTYQANLIIFGLASVAAAFSPSMLVLILLRGVMGLGLGAELVVGYAAMTEFVPPQARGKWVGALSVFVVTSLAFSALSFTLIVANTLIYGFVIWLPSFFVTQGRSIASSFLYSFIMSSGAPVGSAIGTLTADSLGRKPVILGASVMTILAGGIYPFIANPLLLLTTGFLLVVCIYIQVTLLFAIYVPELFPTDVRMRASGSCNTSGRAATMVTPFLVVALLRSYSVGGVLAMIIGLLVVQIIVVLIFGVEPKKRRLEEMDSESPFSLRASQV